MYFVIFISASVFYISEWGSVQNKFITVSGFHYIVTLGLGFCRSVAFSLGHWIRSAVI